MYTPLPKSYKGAFPFKIATTSFIYPDHICPNVRMLGPYLDEIELLFFESAPMNGSPSKHEVEKLSRLAKELAVGYNIHLPIDIEPGAAGAHTRRRAAQAVNQVIRLTAPLKPSTYTLHLSLPHESPDKESLQSWRQGIRQTMTHVLESGIPGPLLSIETLDYPFEWLDEIITEFDLSVCIDTGHLQQYGYDLKTMFAKYGPKTPIVHLYGLKDGRGHSSLARLQGEERKTVMQILDGFRGVVCVEVFSFAHLETSLACLEKWWLEV